MNPRWSGCNTFGRQTVLFGDVGIIFIIVGHVNKVFFFIITVLHNKKKIGA
jgi:hypothetical protein